MVNNTLTIPKSNQIPVSLEPHKEKPCVNPLCDPLPSYKYQNSCVYIHFVALGTHTDTKALEGIHFAALGCLTLYSALSYRCALNKVSQLLLQTVWALLQILEMPGLVSANSSTRSPVRQTQQRQRPPPNTTFLLRVLLSSHWNRLSAGVMEGRESQILSADSPSASSHFWCHMTLSPLQKHLARKEKARAIFKS